MGNVCRLTRCKLDGGIGAAKSSIMAGGLADAGRDVPPVPDRLPLRPAEDAGPLRGGRAAAAAPRRRGGPRAGGGQGRAHPERSRPGNHEESDDEERHREARRGTREGHTHGQAAVPITFGLKMAVFASEVARQRERLREATPRIVVGKMSGAVGTGAAFGPQAADLQTAVMADLGVGVEEAATQVVGRDRHAEFIGVLANLAASLEKFCTEVRNLQRTEIAEVAEAFEAKQVGSSTMAQKENPVASENVCSLARIVRSLVTPALENIPLWHERDLTNSAAERIILPHACVLIDEMLARTTEIFRTLRVYPDRMKANLEATNGQAMAEAVLIALVGKGLGRQEAHRLVRNAAQKARTKGIHLRDAISAEPKVAQLLAKKEIDAALDPVAYIGQSVAIVDAVVKRVR